MNKNGSIAQRWVYASAQLVRDIIVSGTGVGAGATIAYFLDTTLSTEQVVTIMPVALAVWRVVRVSLLKGLPHDG